MSTVSKFAKDLKSAEIQPICHFPERHRNEEGKGDGPERNQKKEAEVKLRSCG